MSSRKERSIRGFTTNHINHTNLSFDILAVVRGVRDGSWLILIFLFLSCNSQKLPVQEITIERDGQAITSVRAEIARTDEERNMGLMHRKKLKDGEGMIFVYDRDDILSFWMKNTLVPLSIAFITSEGRIIEIKDMYPGDLKNVVSSRSVRFALEAPQGWFARAGVQTGDVAGIDVIR